VFRKPLPVNVKDLAQFKAKKWRRNSEGNVLLFLGPGDRTHAGKWHPAGEKLKPAKT